jgi:hypothetical protein
MPGESFNVHVCTHGTEMRRCLETTSLVPCQEGQTTVPPSSTSDQVSDHFHTLNTAARPSTGRCSAAVTNDTKTTPRIPGPRVLHATAYRLAPGYWPSSPTFLSFVPAYAFRPSDMGIAVPKRSTATRPVRL